MLTKQNYPTLLEEINEKAGLIEKNLYENYLNSCTCYPDLEYRTYIQFDENGKITKIFNDGFMPNIRKDLNRDDTICITALTASTANYDSLFYQKQQQIEAELEKELNEKLKDLEEKYNNEIAELKKKYNDKIIDSEEYNDEKKYLEEEYNYDTEILKEDYELILEKQIEQITVSDEELLATYDTRNAFSSLHEYLEYLINYENDTI